MWIFPGTASGGGGTVSDTGVGGGVLSNWAQPTNRISPTRHAGRSHCIIERRDSRPPRRGQTGISWFPSRWLDAIPYRDYGSRASHVLLPLVRDAPARAGPLDRVRWLDLTGASLRPLRASLSDV